MRVRIAKLESGEYCVEKKCCGFFQEWQREWMSGGYYGTLEKATEVYDQIVAEKTLEKKRKNILLIVKEIKI